MSNRGATKTCRNCQTGLFRWLLVLSVLLGLGLSPQGVPAQTSVRAWGRNEDGELGNGTGLNSHTPVQVSGLTGVTALATTHTHNLALKSDRTVWAWGSNSNGQLGDGTTTT